MSKQINDQELIEILTELRKVQGHGYATRATVALNALDMAKQVYLKIMTQAAEEVAIMLGVAITGPAAHVDEERPSIGFKPRYALQPLPSYLEPYDRGGYWE